LRREGGEKNDDTSDEPRRASAKMRQQTIRGMRREGGEQQQEPSCTVSEPIAKIVFASRARMPRSKSKAKVRKKFPSGKNEERS